MRKLKIIAIMAGAVFLAGLGSAQAQMGASSFYATNSAETNYFMGKTGVGTNNPASLLHVAGGLTVSGAMAVPKQGNVSMGSYTNGESVDGISGAGDNQGVQQLIAGAGIGLSPTNGNGVVTITATGSGGSGWTNYVGGWGGTNLGVNLQPGTGMTFRVSGNTVYGDNKNDSVPLFRCYKKPPNMPYLSNVETVYTTTNVDYDTHSGYNLATYRYTIPSTWPGYYEVFAQLRPELLTADKNYVFIYEVTPTFATNIIADCIQQHNAAACTLSTGLSYLQYTGGVHQVYMILYSASSNNAVSGTPNSFWGVQYVRGL